MFKSGKITRVSSSKKTDLQSNEDLHSLYSSYRAAIAENEVSLFLAVTCLALTSRIPDSYLYCEKMIIVESEKDITEKV